VTLRPEVVTGYLDRLGLEVEPPSAEALVRLHRRHVERIPWETLWIHEGETWGLEPAASAARIAASGRGGYCFHLNGALGALLVALGYSVTRHVGGVHGPEGPSDEWLTNHLVLTVTGLPSDECPDGGWYVDVGLGDAMYGPAPFVAGPMSQPPLALRLDPVGADGVGDWHLVHDPRGDFSGMSFVAEPTAMDAFASKHEWLSTAPESGFVQYLCVQRRTASTTEGVRGLVHKVVSSSGTDIAVVEERADWFALLADGFGVVPTGDHDRMWGRLVAAHEAWVASPGYVPPS
jgi:N-hydroxyarylamine O-acetyltransferase